MDLISIIIPVFNIEDCLDRCISSVLDQTYSNLEVILVDDGSSDCCPEICDEWARKDGRIKVIHQKNGGLSAARNSGIDEASGTFILFVDGDDYIASNMVETLYEAIKIARAEMALCDFEKGFDTNFKFSDSLLETEIIGPKEALERIYENNQSAFRYVTAWGKLYHRNLFEQIRYPEGKIFEDMYVTHMLIDRCKKIAVINQKLCYYFQRNNSIVNSTFNIKKLDYLQAMEDRIQFFKNHGYIELAKIAYDEYLHALIWEYSRVRDILKDKKAMIYIHKRFCKVYKQGYSSNRYPSDNALYLWGFQLNPAIIIWYWKISGKWKSLFKKRSSL